MSYNNGIPKDGLHVERIMIKPVSSSYAVRVCATTDCNNFSYGKKYCQSCMNKFETEHNKKRDYYFGVNDKSETKNHKNIPHYNEFVEYLNCGFGIYVFEFDQVRTIYDSFIKYMKLNEQMYTHG